MFDDILDMLVRCTVYCKNKPIAKPLEELLFPDKGIFPFLGWSIDTVGPFPRDGNGIAYSLVAIDQFSKWVKTKAMLSLYSCRAAEFMWDKVIFR